jgi:hypothetical protein
MKRKLVIAEEYCKAPVKTPRFGWLVVACVSGLLIARGIGWAASPAASEEYECVMAFYTLIGAILGEMVGAVTEVVVFRLRFTVSQLLELFIVCAIVMGLWQMCEAHVALRNAVREFQYDVP